MTAVAGKSRWFQRHQGSSLDLTDWAMVPVLLAVGLAGQIALTGGRAILYSPLWMDDIIAEVLATDPSLGHMAGALKAGFDTNPPGFHLLLRIVMAAAGASNELVLRSVPLLFAVLGLWGVYLTHRLVYSRLVALTATAAVWSHPLAVSYAFAVRMYSPWLAACVWFALALNLEDRYQQRLVPKLLVALTSGLVCTLHTFGVCSLVLILLSHSVLSRRNRARILAGLAPAMVGPILMVFYVPFYLGQRATFGYATFILPATLSNLYQFLMQVFPVLTFVTVVVAYFGTLVLTQGGSVAESRKDDVRPLAGLASLVFFPAIIIAVSLLVQPVELPRYAMPVVASLGPLLAPILDRCVRTFLVCALLVLLALSTGNLMGKAENDRGQKAQLDAELRALAPRGSVPVLFKSLHTLLMDWRYSPPAQRAHWAMLDPNDLADELTGLQRISQIFVKLTASWYPRVMPSGASLETLREVPVFYLYGLNQGDVDALRRRFSDLDFDPVPGEPTFYQVRTPTFERGARESVPRGLVPPMAKSK
jgi:hypothetical protein